MDVSAFGVLGILGVLCIWGVIALGTFVLAKLEVHP